MKKTLIVLSILIVFLCSLVWYVFNYVATEFQIREIYLSKTGKYIYFKSKKRGLNFSVITISDSKRRRIDKKKDIVYSWDETLFYRNTPDTLYVFCRHKTTIPHNIQHTIIQKEYSNSYYYSLLDTYKDLGLEKFP